MSSNTIALIFLFPALVVLALTMGYFMDSGPLCGEVCGTEEFINPFGSVNPGFYFTFDVFVVVFLVTLYFLFKFFTEG